MRTGAGEISRFIDCSFVVEEKTGRFLGSFGVITGFCMSFGGVKISSFINGLLENKEITVVFFVFWWAIMGF